MLVRRFAAAAAAALLAIVATSLTPHAATGVGAVSLTVLDSALTENFDTLANTAASTANANLPLGWYLEESGGGGRDNDLYAVDTGGSGTGDTYSYGASGTTDRAFGTLRSGTLLPLIGARFSNDTTAMLTSLDVAYKGEQWRLGTAGRGPDQLDFQYSLDATSLTDGTWTDVDGLDFASVIVVAPTGAKDGNAVSASRSATIAGLSIAPGASFWVRWTDADPSGADDGLSVDDFSITPHGVPVDEASVAVGDVSLQEGDSGAIDALFTVTVTGTHSGITFDIATADGTATTGDADYDATSESVTIPAGQDTYTFAVPVNGDVLFEANETFFVNITGISGGAVSDGQGVGTIVNDDASPVPPGMVISQVYGGGGNSGATYTHDFIELFNNTGGAVDVTGWSVQYNSAAGTGTWQVTPLSGIIPAGGYYLIQEAAGAGGTTPLPAADAVGTGTGIAMAAAAGKVVLRTTATAVTGACPTGNLDLVGYGPTATCSETSPTSATSNTTAALRVRSGCFDSNNNNVDFTIGAPAPRNSATPANDCQPTPAAIHDIQGPGLSTPMPGEDVITSGVVTAKKSNGFFLQAPDASHDSNPATSEAIFVFTQSLPSVAVGSEVNVRGTAGEFFNLTQLQSTLPGDVTVTTASAAVPSAVPLTPAILNPAGTLDQMERYEAMRMEAASLTSVAPTDNFGEIAAVLTGVARPMREPGVSVLDPVPNDPTSGTPDCCIPRFDENPERIFIDSEGLAGSSVLAVTSNTILTGVVGPLDFSFSRYKILPEVVPGVIGGMTAVPVPAPAPGELTVGGFNIENFTASNTTQKQKAALAIRALMRTPDIIGHIEILDQPTLQALADQVNSDAVAAGEPNPQYEARLEVALRQDGTPATQNVGFLVKTSRVRIDAVTQRLAGETFAGGQILHDRPPLVLNATVDPLGPNPRQVIVVVNHLRSFIDIELLDAEGARVREKRKLQAESTARLLQELQTLNPGIPVISVGDYNAYQFNDGYTDPMATLKGSPTPDDQLVVDESPDEVNPNFVNVVDSLPPDERYSFIFEGTPQALDHVLINTAALGWNPRVAVARGNADVPEVPFYTTDPTRPERSSDHDMVVSYFTLPAPTADLRLTLAANPATVTAGGTVTYTATVTNDGPFAAFNVVVTSGSTTQAIAVLAAGASHDVTFTRTAGTCATPNGTPVTTTASVTSDTADPNGGNNSASTTVTVSNAAPVISGVSASRTTLYLPLHIMVPVTINYTASDSCGPVTTSLTVTSDEPVTAPVFQQGLSGLTSPDWQVVDNHHVRLRAERSLRGDGRVYTITITATDAAGGTTTSTVTVTVPRQFAGFPRDVD